MQRKARGRVRVGLRPKSTRHKDWQTDDNTARRQRLEPPVAAVLLDQACRGLLSTLQTPNPNPDITATAVLREHARASCTRQTTSSPGCSRKPNTSHGSVRAMSSSGSSSSCAAECQAQPHTLNTKCSQDTSHGVVLTTSSSGPSSSAAAPHQADDYSTKQRND